MLPDYATHACPAFLADFSDFVDGGLPPARHSELQAHLDCCEGCLQHLRAYRRGIAEYRGITDIHTDANEFWLGMRIRLAGETAPPARRMSWRGPAMAGAAVALVALATVWLGTRIDAGFERVAEQSVVTAGSTPAVQDAPAVAAASETATPEVVTPAPDERPVQLASAADVRSRPSARVASTRPAEVAAADPEFEALREEIELSGWLGDPYLSASSRASFESGGVRIQNASLTY